MSKLKPLYVYCHYVTENNVEIPVTIMYNEIQTFETDEMIHKISDILEKRMIGESDDQSR